MTPDQTSYVRATEAAEVQARFKECPSVGWQAAVVPFLRRAAVERRCPPEKLGTRPWHQHATTRDGLLVVRIFGQIESEGTEELLGAIEAASKVEVHIGCVGGECAASIKLHDALTKKDSTAIIRLASSGGSIVAMGCRRRRISANGQIFIHSASTFAKGREPEFLKAIKTLRELRGRMTAIYSQATAQTPGIVRQWMAEPGRWFSPEASLALGLAHEVIPAPQAQEDFAARVAAIVENDAPWFFELLESLCLKIPNRAAFRERLDAWARQF